MLRRSKIEHLVSVQLVPYFFVIVQIQHLADEALGLDYHPGIPQFRAWCCISISAQMDIKESSLSHLMFENCCGYSMFHVLFLYDIDI